MSSYRHDYMLRSRHRQMLRHHHPALSMPDMPIYHHPEPIVQDIKPRLTPRSQLLAENILKTTRLHVKRRTRQSARLLAGKSASYWLEQKQYRSKDSSTYATSACDRLFAAQELADAVFVHLNFHDTACCLAVSRTIRHAAQQSIGCKRFNMPMVECEDQHLLYLEKQLDFTTSTSDWQRQRFSMNSGNIVFPDNAPAPLLVSTYDIVNTIGEPCQHRVTVDMWFSTTGHTPRDFTLDGSWLNLVLPLPDTVVWIVNITCDCHRTDSFLNTLDFSREMRPRAYKDGTRIVFPYKLVTENGDHLRQIAKYAKKAYRMHRHCQNDYGDVSSGLSSITFHALKRNQSRFDLIDTSTHSNRPSPRFRARSMFPSILNSLSSIFTTTLPQEKTREEILDEIVVELAAPESYIGRVEITGRKFPRRNLFMQNIPSEELMYTFWKLDRLSIWDRFMGRTELKLGY
jgi:hypothetical protein